MFIIIQIKINYNLFINNIYIDFIVKKIYNSLKSRGIKMTNNELLNKMYEQEDFSAISIKIISSVVQIKLVILNFVLIFVNFYFLIKGNYDTHSLIFLLVSIFAFILSSFFSIKEYLYVKKSINDKIISKKWYKNFINIIFGIFGLLIKWIKL